MASLSKEQQAVVLAIMGGKNVFFSGCAGTGKSHLLKLLAQFLPKHSTFFTASTGLAAVNIGGSTLHSFAGVGLGEGSAEGLGFKAKGNRRAKERWTSCRVLVIDEVSMISGQFFDKLETVARFVRDDDRPFGGVQLVLSGDFLQLPPVKATKPTFRADTWEKCIEVKIVLTKVFRQLGDPTFIKSVLDKEAGSAAACDCGGFLWVREDSRSLLVYVLLLLLCLSACSATCAWAYCL
jgi:ATP-dependent DNA helicase PIF1